MIIGLPIVTIVGTAVDDPELRFTPSGAAVANFRVATNKRTKNAAGEWVDGDATFLTVTIWRAYAENVAESVSKGTRVVVVGELKQRSYETREGEKRTVYEVDAEEVAVALRWATAKPQRVGRSNAETKRQGSDPWSAQSSSAAGSGDQAASSDEPPF